MAETASQILHNGVSGGISNGEATYKNPLHTDFRLIETLSQFNRERIPERVVHAKGAGAFGEFEVTDDISDVCNIDMFLGIGKKTECIARFSTTALETGSNESIRDSKGMAVKFFTEQGNLDLVCLNFPMFFIRDPGKFPDLVHAMKRDPKTNLMNPTMWWDFVCKNPETLHMTLVQWGKVGTMFTWRSMTGYTGHAFKWVMPDGSWKYVHLALQTDQPPYTARAIDFTDPDCCTKDLYDAFDRGEYPSWTARIQVIDPTDALDLPFHILDMTKNWPEPDYYYPVDCEKIPWRPFGKLTLRRKPEDTFGEIEQASFSPSQLVPGVEPSEDPMLQARLFAYPDAQRHRLGPQSQKLTINLPKHTATPASRVLANTESDPKRIAWLAETSSKAWSEANEGDYARARAFWEELPKLRKTTYTDDIVTNIAKSIAETNQELRERVYETMGRVAKDLSDRIREATEKIVEENKVPKEVKPWVF